MITGRYVLDQNAITGTWDIREEQISHDGPQWETIEKFETKSAGLKALAEYTK